MEISINNAKQIIMYLTMFSEILIMNGLLIYRKRFATSDYLLNWSQSGRWWLHDLLLQENIYFTTAYFVVNSS